MGMTKIKIREGKKFIHGGWYFGGDTLNVDLNNDQVRNQKASYEIFDANEIHTKKKEKEVKKAVNTDIMKNRMMDTISVKNKRKG